jgi:hypothetical protein
VSEAEDEDLPACPLMKAGTLHAQLFKGRGHHAIPRGTSRSNKDSRPLFIRVCASKEGSPRALREHRRSSGSIPFSVPQA